MALLTQAMSTNVHAQNIDFTRQVRPLLADKCLICHGPDAANRKAELRLDIKADAVRRKIVVASQPASSILIDRITSSDPDQLMPPPDSGKSLTSDQVEILRRWIVEGARWPEHWAFEHPTAVVPPVSDSTWPSSAIDAFVLQALRGAKLEPAKAADPWMLLRRMTLDLTGLPPSPEAIVDFEVLLSKSPFDAFERHLDRLLASPHYGERMALDWLDLARFGDTNGYQDDALRPAWPYRDHVIAAFNSNLPFDQFTIEQLAGDLLPQASLSQRIASGFNRLHRQNEEGGSDPEEFRLAYAVDRTNTAATTWMGLTAGCAQCHDHKYDPISQREYYRLLAFFNSLKGENILNKNPRNNPPQILVPDEQQSQELASLQGQLSAIEKQLHSDEARVTGAFEDWLLLANQEPKRAFDQYALNGSAVARVGKTAGSAYYADNSLKQSLSLDNKIHASGTLNVARSGMHKVCVGHFCTNVAKARPFMGLVVGEGPNVSVRIILPGGKVIASDSMSLKAGNEYVWSYSWNPAAGELKLETRDSDGQSRDRMAIVNTSELGEMPGFDAFGLISESHEADESISEAYFDGIEYSVASDQSRFESFDAGQGDVLASVGEGKWVSSEAQLSTSTFRAMKGISTTDSVPQSGYSISEILALSAACRTETQHDELRAFFMSKLDAQHSILLTEKNNAQKRLRKLEASIPQALVWEEQSTPRATYVLKRGDFQQPGEEVTRGVPAIFHPLAPREEGRTLDRLDLAKWLVSPDHPLTSRVAVNRIWKQFFGQGIVRTMEDFGTQGEPPTHPELLDWLALEFMSDGWDIKRLQRRVLQTAVYRQTSHISLNSARVDVANRYWARASRLRLAAEEVRDMALAVSGLLQNQIGGPSVHPRQPSGFYLDKSKDWSWPEPVGASLYRRGIYTFYRRTTLYPSLAIFDAPQRGDCTVNRPRTNTPLQALVTLNDPVFVEAARAFAQRILREGGTSLERRITYAFRTALTRPPKPEEIELLSDHFKYALCRYQADEKSARALLSVGSFELPVKYQVAELAAWTLLSNTILNFDEVITRE